MKTAHFVTTCDDLVTTFFSEVVTPETRATQGFAAWCDDRDDLFLVYTHARTHARAHARTYLHQVVTVVTNSGFINQINNLICDDLPDLGRHKVVTGRHTQQMEAA